MAQSFTDFELFIVDDGSSDGTDEYCATLTDKRITCIRFKENRGGNSARNEGIRKSAGNIIAFLDDDDAWLPDKLQKQCMVMKNTNADLCYTAKTIIREGKRTKRYSLVKPRFRDMHKAIMRDNFIGSTSTVCIRSSVLRDVGMFDERLPALQDYDLYIRVIKYGFSVKCMEESLLDYFVVEQGGNVSAGYAVFREAVDILLTKYKDDPYLGLLKKSMRILIVKRIFRFRGFFPALIRSVFRK